MIKKIMIFYFILIIIGLSGCTASLEPEKNHQLTNDDLSTYFIITGTPSYISDFEGKKQMINKFDVNAFFDVKKETVTEVNYLLNYTDYRLEEFLLYRNSIRNFPAKIKLMSESTVGGNGFYEIYGVLKYMDSNLEKTHNLYEKILPFEDNELIKYREYKPGLDEESSEYFEIDIESIENINFYTINISLITKNMIHYDFQSWLVKSPKEENAYQPEEVYPFVGIYSYVYANTIITENRLFKDVLVDDLYLQMRIYDQDGEGHIFLWKIPITSLK